MFYEVDYDEDTRILLEGQASGALTKGGASGPSFIPDKALTNTIDLIRLVASKVTSDVAPVIDGTYCSIDITFSIRADGNGTVMIAQDPSLGQFKITIKRPILKRSSST